MIIVWGSGLYGKVDQVPGLCHVATKFGHLWYIPLIPLGSWIVLGQDGNGWQGKEVGLSGKSMLVGWMRGATAVGLVGGVFGSLLCFTDMGHTESATLIAWGAATLLCGLLLFGSYWVPGVGKATHARAVELAEELGLSERGMLMIDLAYGVIDPSEAEYKLKKIEESEPAEPVFDE